MAMPFRPALPMNRANLRCLGLSVGIAIALAGCSAPLPYWSECLNIQTGERVAVIDDYKTMPTVRDKNGYEFRLYLSERPAWRCKR